MDYEPPERADLANVYSLNLEFLELVAKPGNPLAALEKLPSEVAAMLRSLDADARRRLARSPFLLFSLAEQDISRWRELFDGPQEADLFCALDRPRVEEAMLVSAALCFIWQQTIRRPYAARVVCGAPAEWCERLAQQTLIELFRHAASERGLLQFRFQGNRRFWRKLLVAGTSDERAVRRAARLSALQAVLTAGHEESYVPHSAAACALPQPARQVAEQAGVSHPEARGYNTPPDESAVDKKPHQDLRKR